MLTAQQIYAPFPVLSNANEALAWGRTLSWLRATGLVTSGPAIDRVTRAGYSKLASRAYPKETVDSLTTCTQWITWLFLFDDQLDECELGSDPSEGNRVLQNLIELVQEKNDPAQKVFSPIETAWLSFRKTLAQKSDRDFTDQFCRHTCLYLTSLRREIQNRAMKEVPDLLDYAMMRRNTGAVRTVFDLIQVANQQFLPARARMCQSLTTLEDCAIDCISITNDILSYEKEVARGDLHNYVLIVDTLLDAGLPSALELVNRLQTARAKQFERVRDDFFAHDLPSFCFTELEVEACRNYISGLEYWIRANLDFSLSSSRYLDVVRSALPMECGIENITAMPAYKLARACA